MNIFEIVCEKYKITKPVRLIELFAGIGSQAKSLKNLGVEFQHYKICEFDKYCISSYNAIHGTEFVTSDITKITANDLGIIGTDKYQYLMTYSFPCTDLSIAGKGAGMKKGSGTRSGLLWEVERILKECENLPQILLMENVTQVHNKKNKTSFESWIVELEKLGYKNYYQDINAKNYGVAQSRKRCYMVSILGDYYYEFPKPFKLEKTMEDYLSSNVDEKYFINNVKFNFMLQTKFECAKLENRVAKNGIMPTCVWTENQKRMITEDGNIKRYLDSDIVDIFEVGDCADISFPNGYNKGNRVFKGYSPALNTTTTQSSFIVKINDVFYGSRIRKMLPIETWRLMGFADEDFYKAKEVNSDSQLYKQSGNSICVNVLEQIFKQLF